MCRRMLVLRILHADHDRHVGVELDGGAARAWRRWLEAGGYLCGVWRCADAGHPVSSQVQVYLASDGMVGALGGLGVRFLPVEEGGDAAAEGVGGKARMGFVQVVAGIWRPVVPAGVCGGVGGEQAAGVSAAWGPGKGWVGIARVLEAVARDGGTIDGSAQAG